jgi:hypothetical protein
MIEKWLPVPCGKDDVVAQARKCIWHRQILPRAQRESEDFYERWMLGERSGNPARFWIQGVDLGSTIQCR